MSVYIRSYRTHLAETLRLAWPVVVGQMGTMLVGICDAAMVGQLPTEYGSAATLGNSIFFLFVVIGFGICGAVTPLVAQSQGEKNELLTRDYLQQGLWAAIFTTVVVWAAVFASCFVIPHLGQDPRVARLAIEFLNVLGFSIFPLMLFMVLKHFLEGLGEPRPGMIAIFLVVGLNVFLNWLFISGRWIFPEMKLNGAGLATVFARWFGAIVLWIYIARKQKYAQYGLRLRLEKIKEGVFRKLLKVGGPSGMQYFFEIGCFSCAVIMAGMISIQAQKAHNVAIMMAALTYMIYVGFSSAASIRVGNAFGARRFSHLRKAGFSALIAGLIFIAISILCFLLFRDYMALPFVNEKEKDVYEIAVSLLGIAALFQLADGIQAISMGALRGISDVRIPMLFTMISYWGIGIPAAAIMAFPLHMGVQGLWYGLSLGLASSAIFLTWRFARLSRIDRIWKIKADADSINPFIK
jgi:multidrug resistance protein, MATE family